MWTDGPDIHSDIVTRFRKHLRLRSEYENSKGELKSTPWKNYAEDCVLTPKVLEKLTAEAPRMPVCSGALLASDIGKLLFSDGYWNFAARKLRPFTPKIRFTCSMGLPFASFVPRDEGGNAEFTRAEINAAIDRIILACFTNFEDNGGGRYSSTKA
jgi:hypothetical protein